MKTIRFITAIASIASLFLLAGCKKAVIDEVNPDEPEFYVVQIGVGGEIDVTDEPLAKADGLTDLYGVQVYSAPNKELAEGEKDVWTRYAYGLFDDPAAMKVKLIRGNRYKFEATMVRDGENKLKNYGTAAAPQFSSPFFVYGDDFRSCTVDNMFSYQYSTYMTGIQSGSSYLASDGKEYQRPNTDRYYGELEGFVPGVDEKAEIKMKRASFGATYVIVNSIARDGYLEIKMTESPRITVDFAAGELDKFWAGDIYTFSGVRKAYLTDDYTETVPVTINWHRADGTTFPLGTHNITFKRNRMSFVNVLIKNSGTDSGIGMAIDESESVDMDNMESAGDTTIEDGAIVDTEVDPDLE